MSVTRSQFLFVSLLSASIWTASNATADEQPSRFYEDDAWYDVSEWFDGNDYNPTDEAIGRWDNEVFEFSDAATSTDRDNDQNWGDYGYADNTADDDRWFYDYYDDGYRNWYDDESGWKSYTIYNDSNDDGVYDSFSNYYDRDNDGRYEDFTYYSFDASGDKDRKAQAEARDRQKDASSQRGKISGTVDKTKMVKVRDRVHLIANVKMTDGQMMPVDLGPKQTTTQLFEGDQLTATGHPVKVGDRTLMIATEAQSKNADIKIDRNGRKYSGKIDSTREVTVNDAKHLMAKIKTESGKSMLVDLGAKDQLSNAPGKGAKVTVQGIPVKVNERVVLVARSLEQDGKKTDIKPKSSSKN